MSPLQGVSVQLFSECWRRPGFAGMPLQIDHVLGIPI